MDSPDTHRISPQHWEAEKFVKKEGPLKSMDGTPRSSPLSALSGDMRTQDKQDVSKLPVSSWRTSSDYYYNLSKMMSTNQSAAMETEEVPRYPPLPQLDDDKEWQYVMRRTMQEVVPGLFLGPFASAARNNLENMKAAGITHVVCVRSEIEAHVIRANHMDHFQYFIMQMDNSPMESIIPKVRLVATFIDNCLANGGKVLIHGNTGMSRSPTLAVGYIMGKFGVSYKKAQRYVQQIRFCINIPEAFKSQLIEYEPIYLAAHAASEAATKSSPDPQYRLTKRKIEEVGEGDDDDDDVGQQQQQARRKLDTNDDGSESNDVVMDEDEDL